MTTATLTVEGMSCGHCVKAVEENVGKLQGVQTVKVDLAAGKVDVEYDGDQVDVKKITDTIEDQGYDVV